MKNKCVYQRNTNDCGVACLLSIIKYYRGNNTFENVRKLTRCGSNGITALNLVEASKKLGFKSRGLKCNYEDLNNLKKPLICHTILQNGYNHYIVLYKVNKNVVVFDPYLGIKKYTKEDFLKIWTGIVIELEPVRKIDIIKDNYFEYFKQVIKKHKNLYLKIILYSLFSIILTLIINYYFKALLDFNNLSSVFTFFMIVVIIKEFNDFFRNNALVKLENNILIDLNLDTHKKILSLPYYYFNSRTSGDIITKFNDLEHVKILLVKFPIYLFINIILLIFTSIILYIINSKLFIIFFTICIFYLLITIMTDKKLENMISVNQEQNSIKNAIFLENIKCISTIKNMNIKNLRHSIFKKVHDDFIISNINYEKFYIKINLIKNIILFMGINLVLFIGMKLVNTNEILLSDLILFNSLIMYFIDPLRELFELSPIVKNGINAIKRLSEIYDTNISNKNKIKDLNLDIKFNNLNFSYNGYDKVLNNINYSINFKDKMMVIGESGCGKSTLFKLLSKIYEVDNNMIRIGESDINDVEISDIITYVSEDEKLFNDTIYNNIVLDNNDDFIDDILEITGVNNMLVKNNLNLNSVIEEEGTNISKGEKQKIILSRVLLKNSKIIILDESLSGIEESEEYQIIEKVLSKYKDSTIIYISHSKVCMNLFNKILDFNKLKEEL